MFSHPPGPHSAKEFVSFLTLNYPNCHLDRIIILGIIQQVPRNADDITTTPLIPIRSLEEMIELISENSLKNIPVVTSGFIFIFIFSIITCLAI